MIVALIPARGNSKRIPRKNIRLFHGKPLISYSIEAAKRSNLFSKIIVSTDDSEIAAIANHYGAKTPFVRPAALSDDYTTTNEIIEHAKSFFVTNKIEVDYLCTIYPTAPMIDEKYLIEGYDQLKNSNATYAFSCTTMPYSIWRTFKITNNNRCEMFWQENFYKRSQDLEPAYQDAGQFYWENLHKKTGEIIFGKDSIPIVLPRYIVQDIDTLEDWKNAELIYEIIQKRKDEYIN